VVVYLGVLTWPSTWCSGRGGAVLFRLLAKVKCKRESASARSSTLDEVGQRPRGYLVMLILQLRPSRCRDCETADEVLVTGGDLAWVPAILGKGREERLVSWPWDRQFRVGI